MITIKANLHLYDNIRKKPFSNGYRPAFDFDSKTLTSGRITLLDGKNELFFPGEIREVKIDFMFYEFVKNKLRPGEKIYFYEGSNCIGDITIKDILSS